MQDTIVRRMLRHRRARDRILGGDLFADPAWDMLLELYAADQEGHATTEAGLCASVPIGRGTALRWIDALESRGLIDRRLRDPAGDTGVVTLTADTRSRIETLIADWV